MEKLLDLSEEQSLILNQVSDEITKFISERNLLNDSQFSHIVYELPRWIFKISELCSDEEKKRLGIKYVLIDKNTKKTELLDELDNLDFKSNFPQEIVALIQKNHTFLVKDLKISIKDKKFIEEQSIKLNKILKKNGSLYTYKEDKGLLTDDEFSTYHDLYFASLRLDEILIAIKNKDIKYINEVLPYINF